MVSKEPKFNGLHHCADHQDQKDKLEVLELLDRSGQQVQPVQQDHKVLLAQLVAEAEVGLELLDHKDLPEHKVHKVFKV
jgi:hypothetical protein